MNGGELGLQPKLGRIDAPHQLHKAAVRVGAPAGVDSVLIDGRAAALADDTDAITQRV